MWQLVKKVVISLIFGLILLNSQTNCLDWKFAVTTSTDIRFFDANWTYTNHRIRNDNHLRGVSVFAYDGISGTLYYVNNNNTLNKGQIYELENFEDEAHSLPKLLITINTTIRGIAFDAIDRNLYWSEGSRIMQYNIDIKSKSVFLQVNDTLPTDITLDICGRQLYFIKQHANSTSIEKVDLENQTVNAIVEGLTTARSVTVDYYSNKIYWLDNMRSTTISIEEANLDGTERREIFRQSATNPLHLITDVNYIYYSSATYKNVIRIGKHDQRRTIIDYKFESTAPVDILMKQTATELGPYKCKETIAKLTTRSLSRLDANGESSTKRENINTATCNRDFCLNGGKCSTNIEQGALCECPLGFGGNRCEIDKCNNFCMNDMKCSINNNGDPVCACDINKFSGERCEEDIKVNLCHNYCLNDGTCTINNHGVTECHCNPSFTGDRCQSNLCPSSYCLNSGICVVEEDKPVCICKLQYKGSRCEITSLNSTNYDNYCLNGGILDFENGMATCKCPASVSGARCQETLCKNYCLNNGVCNLIDGKPSCECDEGIKGDRCQIELTFREIYNKSCNGDTGLANLYEIDINSEVCLMPSNQIDCNCMSSSITVVTIGLLVSLLLLLITVVLLKRVYKPLRPKVKKTYVVRKNFTPLTSRPGGAGTTEQCEITIEDCCNMNICETPCFDPKILQSCDNNNESPVGKKSEKKRKEDKRKLLDVDFSNCGELY